VFSYFPAIQALRYAFSNWDGILAARWTGFQNFTQLFHDPIFLQSLAHVSWWSIIAIPLGIIASVLTAVGIYRLKSSRAQYWFRFFFVLTMAVPPLVGILVWIDFYAPGGALDIVLKGLGLGRYGTAWLANPSTALGSVILAGFPWVGAFGLLVVYAGLQRIPTELIDAARVDGVSSLERFWYVEVPLIMGQIKLLLILSLVGITQNLLTPLLMTDGGPGNSTITPVLYMYQNAFEYDLMGYAMAIAFLLFLASMVLSVLGMKYIRTGTEDTGVY
jgi:raffinose/stachyose/melibiose transport system permease protein